MTVLTAVYEASPTTYVLSVRNQQMCVALLELIDDVINRVLVSTEKHPSVIQFSNLFVDIVEIVTSKELDRSSGSGRNTSIEFLSINGNCRTP